MQWFPFFGAVVARQRANTPRADKRARPGVMEDKHATKGIMVTTSWVTSDGHEFANRHGRIEIMECEHVKYLCKNTSTETCSSACRGPHRNDGNQSSYRPCADVLFLLGKGGDHPFEPSRHDVNYQK
jgi:hypothetical protein